MSYHAALIHEIIREFQTNETEGLTLEKVERRQQTIGYNILPETQAPRLAWALFFDQWKSPLLIILLFAGTLSGFLGEYSDMAIIYITAFVNACIGFGEEFKANKSLEKLKQLVEKKTMVIRGGQTMSILAKEAVPGDIMLFSAGDTIVADARVLVGHTLQINEAALTGESNPVHKHPDAVRAETPLAERTSMVFSGTTVMNGRGVAVVVKTGQQTEIGQIAALVKNTKEEKTPLQVQLSALGGKLGLLVVGICFFVVMLGLFLRPEITTLFGLFQIGVALAVAAIPEGLVITVTVILAIGMQHILRRKALVRKLLAAETLGSVTVICTDKTGTLTEGTMEVTHVMTADERYEDGALLIKHPSDVYTKAMTIAALCNDAIRKPETREMSELNQMMFLGDTTEVALSLWAERVDIRRDILEEKKPRIAELPFQSETKYMATLHGTEKEKELYVKGGSDILLPRSTHILTKQGVVPLTDEMHRVWRGAEERMTAQGLRVLAVAYKTFQNETIEHTDITGLTLVGLVGLSDPIRKDVFETIVTAKKAGIHIIMMTGDHERTAYTIGAELGLVTERSEVMQGAVLDTLTEAEFQTVLQTKTVFARVSPEHKLKIVQALQKNGEVVAMTGDGVNDTPALKAADVGIALGSGTDVAKEVADMVLMHDSFSTIVAAIEEGRRIYQNIQTVVVYLLSGSLSEVVLIVGSMVAGLPLALLPAHILWINIVQESFLTMALAFDPAHKETMQEKPRSKRSPLLNRPMLLAMSIVMLITNAALFALFYFVFRSTESVILSRTMLFVGLGCMCALTVYPLRGLQVNRRRIPIFSNDYLTGAVVMTFFLLILTTSVPFIRNTLQLTTLPWEAWGMLFLLALLTVGAVEWILQWVIVRKKT